MALVYEFPDKPPVAAVNIHADALSAKQRNSAIGRAVDLLDSIPAEGVKILAGDLNLDIDLDKRRDLFTDDEHLDVETYNYVAARMTDAAVNAGSTAEPDRRLDYIFVKGGALKVVRAGPWKGQRVPDMDHDPVVADLR